MRLNCAVLLLGLWVLCPVPALSDVGVLNTRATGEASVFPDLVKIQFEISSKGEDPSISATETAQKYSSVADALAEGGIEEGEIVSIRFHVSERIEYDPETRKKEMVGYVASHIIQIELQDFTKIGPIVDAVIKAGADKVARIHFSSTKLEETQNTALEQAVERVLVKAEIMARTAGGKLGQLLELDSSREREVLADMAGGKPQSVPTTIIPDMIRAHVTVKAKWEFLPGDF